GGGAVQLPRRAEEDLLRPQGVQGPGRHATPPGRPGEVARGDGGLRGPEQGWGRGRGPAEQVPRPRRPSGGDARGPRVAGGGALRGRARRWPARRRPDAVGPGGGRRGGGPGPAYALGLPGPAAARTVSAGCSASPAG